MTGETSDSSDTSAELVAWTGLQPAAGRLGPAAAIELLPGDQTQDPFTRLVAASWSATGPTAPAATWPT